jgi:hypothetical protein
MPGGGAARPGAPPAASLWAGAGACRTVAPPLEARLAARRAAGGAPGGGEALARGGRAPQPFTFAEETGALKAVRLQALREELRAHEATAGELRRQVAVLEAELGLPTGG